ncbi:MAG: hypothetical protein JXE06_03970 [Coriobacteriia bacterium]|nr:hypothetical protein [Coriobacteriia bacterium]MBN2822642.1 hypothetical protein [Coriobacteriia bacterium]
MKTQGQVRRFVTADEGVALVTVLGVMAVLTILVASSFFLARQSYTSTDRLEAESQAFQKANAGIDTMYADLLANSSLALDNYGSGGRTLTVGDGTVNVSLESMGSMEYSAIATGYAADGTPESIKVRFFYLSIWDMFIAAGEDEDSIGGGKLNGNANVDGPFYVRGDLSGTGSMDFTGGPLLVTGDIDPKGAFTVGTTAEPIKVYCGGTYPTGWPSNKNFHTVGSISAPPEITLPVVDADFLDTAWSRAKTESVDNLQGTVEFSPTDNVEVADIINKDATTYPTALGGTWVRPKAPGATENYKVIGASTPSDIVTGGSTNLVLGTADFGSWYGDGKGYTVGQWDDFAYDYTGGAYDILYLEGTVVVDGDVTFNRSVKYRGNGALIVNGDVTIMENLKPYSGDMQTDEVLGIICTGSMYIYGEGNDDWTDPDVAAALWSNGSMNFEKQNSVVKGSIIAPLINFPQANFHLYSDPNLPTFLPWSMPGRDAPLLLVGSWSRS